MTVSLSSLISGIRQRKVELGIVDTPDRLDALRNNGSRRKEAKRAMLARIDERAEDADVAPLKVNC